MPLLWLLPAVSILLLVLTWLVGRGVHAPSAGVGLRCRVCGFGACGGGCSETQCTVSQIDGLCSSCRSIPRCEHCGSVVVGGDAFCSDECMLDWANSEPADPCHVYGRHDSGGGF